MKDVPPPTYAQQKSFYDRHWFGWLTRMAAGDEVCRFDFIVSAVRRLARQMGRRPAILDLGCGRGWLTHALARYGDTVGVDLSTAAATSRYPRLHFIEANAVTDDIPGRYDIVVSSEVIEHLTSEDQRDYVSKAASLLNEGGHLVLTTPNRPVAAGLFEEVARARQHRQPIENWLDKETLTALLSPGFEVLYAGSTVFYPIRVRKSRLSDAAYFLVYAHTGLFKLVNRRLAASQRGLYLTVIARKRLPQRPPGAATSR